MVAISHSHKFIFIKPRKVAGTSVEMFLEPFCREPGAEIVELTEQIVTEHGIIGARGRGVATSRWFNHIGAIGIRERLGADVFDSYTKITAVRNPFDRALSCYFWVLTSHGRPLPQSFEEARDGFRRFVLGRRFPNFRDRMKVHLDGRFVADFTVRFESLKSDLEELATRLDLDLSRTHLPETKVTRDKRFGQPTAAFFDIASVERVLKADAWMFARFGYPSTPFEFTPAPAPEPLERRVLQ